MAKCKWCEKGNFLTGKVNHIGLCEYCNKFISMDANNRLRIINDSVYIVKTSENTDTVLSRFEIIMQNAEALYQYEKKGIQTINPPPSEYLKDRHTDHDIYLLEALAREIKKVAGELVDLKTPKAKLNKVAKITEKANKYKLILHNPIGFAPIEKKLTNLNKLVS